ncbi:presequence protease, mitochondrial-like [Rhopilema esculentum]|uniref:presequence protease, mitochondrial-like n=1 Tax=Rhopilema esculentum TaxID=499914 RepID=UPI0031E39CA3
MLKLLSRHKLPWPKAGLRSLSNGKNVNVLAEARQFKEGDSVHGYKVVQNEDIPDFHMVAVKLKHERTGAEHLHIARDDQNNVFSVTFRTTPMDSTGVPHILEHTTLCGSKKFPCRDPFFKMLNRSLSTFMNAWTASDYTMYPFSTQNGTDYSNLMSVYLDAVFFPNLRELDFLQEGWRLENEKVDDPSSPLVFKGVVFNEMKGAFSNPESLFATHYQNLLLPSHTYGYVSGGDPLVIPELTWAQLKDFHRTHYHPSNSKFYTYGDLPLEKHLQQINDQSLNSFEKLVVDTKIINEPRWSEPRRAEVFCPPDNLAADAEKQTTISVGYLLDSTTDPFKAFTMGILSTLLASGPNSPFYQALIKPNIGSGYSPVVGVDTSTKDATFGVGLQGVSKKDVPKILDIIKTTFEDVAGKGFEDERIQSILHRVELAQKHQTSSFGLGVISSLMSSWNHDAEPISMLRVDEQVENFRNALSSDKEFLQKMVQEYFLENTHQLTLEMNPKEDYIELNEKREAEILESKVKKLTDEDKKIIFEKSLELEQQQNLVDDLSCLPKMLVKDIDKQAKRVDVDIEYGGNNIPIQICEQPTNGVCYFRAIADASALPENLKQYLPLFCSIITKMGAGSMNYEQLAQEVEMYTGGLSVGPHIVPHHTDQDKFELGVMFGSKCLDRNIPRMFSLWQDILNEPNLKNLDRLRTLINSIASDLAMSVADSGHAYAMAVAASQLTPVAKYSELFGGMSQVWFMRNLAEMDDLEQVSNSLIEIASYILNANDLRCSLNVTAESRGLASNALNALAADVNTLGTDEIEFDQMPHFAAKKSKTFIPMPFPVNYVSRCMRTVPYTHQDSASLQILGKLLSAKYLHREIREKGGAYGGGARHGGSTFSFFSYRDPNSTKTLKAFDESIQWAVNSNFTDEDIEEAKLSVFASIDSPVSPGNKGITLFSQRITHEMRQQFRDRLFQVNRDGILDVAKKYLASDDTVDSMAVIGPENTEFEQDESWEKKTGL